MNTNNVANDQAADVPNYTITIFLYQMMRLAGVVKNSGCASKKLQKLDELAHLMDFAGDVVRIWRQTKKAICDDLGHGNFRLHSIDVFEDLHTEPHWEVVGEHGAREVRLQAPRSE